MQLITMSKGNGEMRATTDELIFLLPQVPAWQGAGLWVSETWGLAGGALSGSAGGRGHNLLRSVTAAAVLVAWDGCYRVKMG